MPTDDLLDLLSESRLRIIELIKFRGSLTVETAAEQLELSETTIRQHLTRLSDDELVDAQPHADGPGRPTLVYRLTPRAQRLFPSQDDALLGKLLQFLLRRGYPDLVDEFFRSTWEERRQRLARRIDDAGADTLDEQLAILDQFLTKEGFAPDIETDDERVVIRECNCPFSEGVRATQLPCRLETEFFERILHRDVERTSHIPAGDPACCYTFTRDDSDT